MSQQTLPPEAEAGAGPAPVAHPRRRRWLVVAALAVGLLLLGVRTFVAEPLRIATGSMRPTLSAGDQVLVDHLSGLSGWHAGEVVLLHAPDGRLVVKRIVATGGERVGIRDGHLVVDGVVQDEPWSDAADIDSVYFGPVTVPAGSVFVLGDHRSGSEDSRSYGAVPTSSVEGRVVAVLWPPSHAGAVR